MSKKAAPKKNGLASIYGLYDRQGRLRYIGKANDPEARLYSHMRDARRRDTPVYRWIRKNGKPDLRILESNCEDWREAEIRLIAAAKKDGANLLNVAVGGEEPHCPQDVRQRNAAALNKAIATDPTRRRLREIKAMVRNADRANHLSERHRSIFRGLAAMRPDLFGCWSDL